MTASALGAPAMGSYVYCIGRADRPESLTTLGLRGRQIRTVSSKGLVAFVSDYPVGKVSLTRENTMIHQKVMEEAMREETVLPVRFSTIAEPKNGLGPDGRIAEKLLKERRKEFCGLLEAVRDKREIGLKAVWTDMPAVFKEIVEESRKVRELRARTAAAPTRVPRRLKMALGEAVRDALLAKKKAEGDRLLAPLKGLADDFRINKTFGDSMLLNAAFLVRRDRDAELDKTVEELSRGNEGRIRLRYVGPVPICNFVEIVVSWD